MLEPRWAGGGEGGALESSGQRALQQQAIRLFYRAFQHFTAEKHLRAAVPLGCPAPSPGRPPNLPLLFSHWASLPLSSVAC